MGSDTRVVVDVTVISALALQMRLTNEADDPVEMPAHQLPWSNAYSTLVVAVETDAPGTVLERSTPVDDPVVGMVTVQPRETLTGQIDLGARFPGLTAALAERDVVVFWSWQLQPLDGQSGPRTGGWVLLPRR
jgi:hypothetical protein